MKRMTAALASIILVGGLAAFSPTRAQEPSKTDADGLKYPAIALKEAPRIGEFWVGMEVTQPSDDERKKLEIPADRGIVVQQIVPDGPAAKSGLKVGDVLLKAGDKPLKELSDALEAIRQAKDSDLTFEYLRDGKSDKVTIKPAKRPSGFGFEEAIEPSPTAARNAEAQKELAKARERQSAMAAQAQGMMGGASELQKIRAELHQIQEHIGAIDRQLAQLEASRGGPNHERIMRQMMALKRAIGELMEGDRPEDAERLKGELRRLNEQFQAAQRGEESPGGGAMDSPRATMPGAPVDVQVNDGFKVRRLAIVDGPEKPIAKLGTPVPSSADPRPTVFVKPWVDTPPRSDAAVAELRKQVEQLRHELSELRDQAAKAKKE
jgi:PDZ domain